MKSWISSKHIEKQKYWVICCINSLFSIKLIANLVTLNSNLSGKVSTIFWNSSSLLASTITYNFICMPRSSISLIESCFVDVSKKIFSTTEGKSILDQHISAKYLHKTINWKDKIHHFVIFACHARKWTLNYHLYIKAHV